MLAGFGYLFSQIALLLVLAILVGVVIGHFAWPRHTAPVPAHPAGEFSAARPGSAGTGEPASGEDSGATPAGGRAGSSARSGPPVASGLIIPSGLAVSSALVPTSPPRGSNDSTARLSAVELRAAEAEARLADAETRLLEARRRLGEADAELLRMRAHAQALADQKEAEMGRLESGAIAALESTIAAHQEQVNGLEEQLRAATDGTREREQELEAERRRVAQLQTALAQRDEHVASLMARLAEQSPAGGGTRPEAGAAH